MPIMWSYLKERALLYLKCGHTKKRGLYYAYNVVILKRECSIIPKMGSYLKKRPLLF